MKYVTKINTDAAESITVSTLKQHIKIQDKLASEAYNAGFSANGDYNDALHTKMFLEGALEYFRGMPE